MNKIKYWLIAINLVAVLSYFGMEIAHKEDLLKHGTQVYLKLRPTDPRSLMQGDYMRLRFAITDKIPYADTRDSRREGKGIMYAIVSVPDGEYIRTQMDFEGIAPGEVAIKIFSKNYGYYLSSENYFFEEGTGLLYNNAKYALVVVDDEGNIYIKNLCDKDRNVIEKGQLSTDEDMLQTDEEEAELFWENDL